MKIHTTKYINVIGLSILSIIVICGFFATCYMTTKVEDDERANLLLRAQIIATLLDTNDLSKLTGQDTDLSTKEYTKIKASLERIHELNIDSRFVYIMGQKYSSQFFYVDAEPQISADFSPPGQIYTEAGTEDIANFSSKIPYTKGPYTDRWGTWFTAYAPIFASDQQIREIGIDIQADKLLLRIKIVRQATIMIFSLIFLAVLSVLILLRNSSLQIKDATS